MVMLGRVALLLCLLTATAAAAQPYRAPRTPSGAPDLQGTWDNDSMTRLQRPKGFAALVATPYEAAAFEAKGYQRFEKVVAPVDPNAPAPELDGVKDDDRFERPRGLDRSVARSAAPRSLTRRMGACPTVPKAAPRRTRR